MASSVLIIGGTTGLREVAELLRREEIVAHIATQLDELGHLVNGPIGLIVVDIEFGVDLRQLCQGSATPIVVIGSAPEGAHNVGDQVDFVSAQFEPAELLSRIKLHLRLRDAQDQTCRFQAITNAASDAVISADSAGNIYSWNSGATRLFGYEEHEARGRPLDIIIPERDLDAHHQGLKRFLDTGRLSGPGGPVAVRALSKDGRELHVELSLGAGTTPAGPFVVAIIRDLSKRDAAEQDMHKLQRAVEQSGASIVITNLEGAIEYVNPAFEKTTGYTRSEAIGKNPRVLKSGRQTKEMYTDLWNTLLRGETWRGELQNKAKDGRLFWEDATISGLADAHGRVTHFVAVKADITHSKWARSRLEALGQELAVKQKNFVSIIERTTDAIIVLDDARKILFVNKAAERLFVLSSGELARRGIDDIPLDAGETQEVCIPRPSGDPGWAEVRIEPTEWLKSPARLLMLRDVTERHYTAEELHAAQLERLHANKLEAVGQLAAGIAHEINTPMQYVGNNTEFFKMAFERMFEVLDDHHDLLAQCRTQPLSEDLWAQLQKRAKRAKLPYLRKRLPKTLDQTTEGVNMVSRIVSAMKSFSHPGSEEKVPTDLNKCIEATIDVSRSEWKYVCDLQTELSKLPMVPCLPGEFNQVILNLIVNSAHAIADVAEYSELHKGTICITTKMAGDVVEVKISDSGAGMPESVRTRIFDPFFTTKEVGKGTGQGLAIARSVIVDKHAGTIQVESETGKGTTFTIQLPLVASANSLEAAQ